MITKALSEEPRSPGRPRSLSDDQAREAREKYACDDYVPRYTIEDLAGEYGISKHTMRLILTGETYTDCGGPIMPIADRRARCGRRSAITEHQRNHMLRLRQRGVTLTEIADRVQLSVPTVRRELRRNGSR